MWRGRSLCFWCVSCPGWSACRLWAGGSSWWSWWWSRLSWSRCWTPQMQTASTGSCSARARPYHSFLWVKPQQRSAIILEYFSNNIQLLYFCHILTKACMPEWIVHKIKCQSLIQTREKKIFTCISNISQNSIFLCHLILFLLIFYCFIVSVLVCFPFWIFFPVFHEYVALVLVHSIAVFWFKS